MTNDGVGLPVRLHDLLLALAGRVDDDALTQARELLAVAELDRAVELLVGVLLAGRIPVSVDERRELGRLLGEVRSDSALADRLFAVEQVPVPRHRFTVESDPAEGLAEILGKTASVLPDVRSVRATWRSSPAGATPGPLPQRVILVDVGPSGFAPATAYRLDTVLRQAGIRAAVEVLTVGVPLGDYHGAAVTTAREVFYQSASASISPPDSGTWFDGEVRDEAPVVEPEPVPVEPEAGSKPSRRARVDPFEGAQPFPPKPVKRLPVREVAPLDQAAGPDHATSPDRATGPEHASSPDHVMSSDRVMSSEHAMSPDRVMSDHEDPPQADEPHREPHGEPTHAQNGTPHLQPVDSPQPDPQPEALSQPHAKSHPQPAPQPLPQSQPHSQSRPTEEPPLSRSEVTTELGPDDLAALQAALADSSPDSRIPDAHSPDPHTPASVHLPPTVDAKLSDRERALLQQLHEELAQREQQSWPAGPEYVNGIPKPNNGKYPG